jgi:hypothetical protein
MLIIAHHAISDPESFWGAAKDVTMNLPGNLKLHGVYPARDGKTGTCLWEANSVEEVQQFLDKNAGQYAQNSCYEVNVEGSIGLPAIHLAEEHLA